MFDEYLHHRAKVNNEKFFEFTSADYLTYVDGKPRYSKDIRSDPRCTLEECKKAGIRSFAAWRYLLFSSHALS